MSAKKQPEKTPVHNPEPEPAASAPNYRFDEWNPMSGPLGFILYMLGEGYAIDRAVSRGPSLTFSTDRVLENKQRVTDTVVITFPPSGVPTVDHSFEAPIKGRPATKCRFTLHTPLSYFMSELDQSCDRLERMWIACDGR